MEITWKYIKPLDDPSAVMNFLKAYNVELPDKLTESIEKFNGGRPSEKQIITSSKREYVFKSMLSYNRNDKETIYSVFPELFKGTQLFPFVIIKEILIEKRNNTSIHNIAKVIFCLTHKVRVSHKKICATQLRCDSFVQRFQHFSQFII